MTSDLDLLKLSTATRRAVRRVFGAQEGPVEPLSVNSEICVNQFPAPQLMVDIMSGWSSKFPDFAGVTAGGIPLFQDTRVTWALDLIGGVAGKTILELGPLEGGHTYMLSKAGAASITAIEANKQCFLRCLISKELLDIQNSHFLYGDFVPWLQQTDKTYDVIWSAGVLYHLVQPVDVLHLIGQKARQVHFWTHYVPDEGYDRRANWAKGIFDVENRQYDGRTIPHYLRAYGDAPKTAAFNGGVYQYATWLRRSDILAEVERAGFNQIHVGFEDIDHPNGPAFALTASQDL